MWALTLLACGGAPSPVVPSRGAPSPEAYAVGVEMLVERVLVRARNRVRGPECREGVPAPEDVSARVAGDHPIVPVPGFTNPDAAWTGRVDVGLTATDDAYAWDLVMAWTDVQVREFTPWGWDPACGDAMTGGCAIDWDPPDYSFAGTLAGTLRIDTDGHATSCDGLLYDLSADVTGALDATTDTPGTLVDLHVWSESATYSGGGGATGTVADMDVDFSWEWFD